MANAPALHSSLRARTNLLLAGGWLGALLCVVWALGRVPWTMLCLGLVSGVLQGVFQRCALRGAAPLFLKARSALDVRAALVSTSAGRAHIKVLWGSLALYFAVALLETGRPTTPRLGLLLFSAILAQWFVRESVTVQACAQLEKASVA